MSKMENKLRVFLVCWLVTAVMGMIVCVDILREPLPGQDDLMRLEVE